MVVVGPRAVAETFDAQEHEARRLLPAREPLRTAIEADWQRFNGQLAADVAAVAYFQLLPQKDIMIEPFSRGLPAREAALTRPAYPVLRAAFRLLLDLRAPRIADALVRIRTCVARVDARLGDGRRFLHGAEPSLADLALAAALAPLTQPDGCRSPLPRREDMPPRMQDLDRDLGLTPTFALIERVYAVVGGGILPDELRAGNPGLQYGTREPTR